MGNLSYYSRFLAVTNIFLLVTAWMAFPQAALAQPLPLARPGEAAFRRPVAIAANGSYAVTANVRAGTLSLLDADTGSLVGEFRIGQAPVDIQPLPGGRSFVVLCRDERVARIVECSPGAVTIVAELPTPFDPARVAVHDSGRLAVSARWSRRLAIYQRRGEQWMAVRTIDLPFAPRALCFHPNGNSVVVADAFGSTVAEIAWDADVPTRFSAIEGHGIADLAISHDRTQLLVAHRLLQPHVRTLRERIFWGNVMNNFLRGVAWEELHRGATGAEGSPSPIAHWNLLPLGEPSHGTGDPTAVAIARSGAAVICLGGVDEIAIRPAPLQPMLRFAVGRYPVDAACSSDSRRAFVANQFDDSVTIVDLRRQRPLRTVKLGAMPTAGPIERGESLFHDARLSHDGWFSCQSCHIDGHTNHQLNDNLGDGSYGAPKRVLSLLGVADTPPWSWMGTQDLLSRQVEKSIRTTMRGPEEAASRTVVDDLTAYLRTLEPPPGIAMARGRVDEPLAQRGAHVFRAVGCADCHRPPFFTTSDLYDIGVSDEQGRSEFNPPSLRGVSQRDRWLHDGRATNLREAINAHQNIDLSVISPEDWEALVHFLETL